MKRLWRAAFPLLGLTLTALACGARSEIVTPEGAAAGGGGAGGTTDTVRTCLPDCTIGHQCCFGGCDGPMVATETDCCTCLDNEVRSNECPGSVCGGGQCTANGDGCASDDECCSERCDYPAGGGEKKNCQSM